MTEQPISRSLLDLLRCPVCEERPKVRLEGEKLVCDRCGRAYPISNGIPVMQVEDADGAEESK